jgi:hypothetical protein
MKCFPMAPSICDRQPFRETFAAYPPGHRSAISALGRDDRIERDGQFGTFAIFFQHFSRLFLLGSPVLALRIDPDRRTKCRSERCIAR